MSLSPVSMKSSTRTHSSSNIRHAGRSAEQQREYPVYYRGHFIGKLVPDLTVEGKVIADPKVVTAFNETHTAQMLGYLNITGLEVALLLNFKEAKLDWKRVVTGNPEKELATGDTEQARAPESGIVPAAIIGQGGASKRSIADRMDSRDV